jgi:AraC-like DNA-binding protein
MPTLVRRRLAALPLLRPPVVDLFLDECPRELARVVMPSPHLHVVIRYGDRIPGGVDAHVMGARQHAYRKRIRGGQRTVFARLAPGALGRVLGASPKDLAGRAVALGDLWGQRASDQLLEQLVDIVDPEVAARILAEALSMRCMPARAAPRQRLVQAALARLEHQDVAGVACSLGVSPRHLRRIFQDEVGLSPKSYSRLCRFDHAWRSAARTPDAPWSSIAADAGYCDQAHLISEFRSIAGAPPRKFMHEIAGQWLDQDGMGPRPDPATSAKADARSGPAMPCLQPSAPCACDLGQKEMRGTAMQPSPETF